jgi:hypothetical protein
MEKKKKEDKKEEKVSEIFEVEKNGKEKIIEAHGMEKEKPESKDQLKKEKKIFLIVILTMVGFAALFAATYFISDSFNHINIEGVKFTVDKTTMPGRTLYRTSLPVTYNGSRADYNFYLRGNPTNTNKIPFNGNLSLMKNMVINQASNFNCDGDGIIGIANVLKLYNILGVSVISDKNATCDSLERYVFLNIKEGNETKIEQTGRACYEMQVKGCEILPATERFMIKTFIETNELLKDKS